MPLGLWLADRAGYGLAFVLGALVAIADCPWSAAARPVPSLEPDAA
jgi:hypothetical protein